MRIRDERRRARPSRRRPTVASPRAGSASTGTAATRTARRVPDGVYHYTIEATGDVGEPASASGRIGVDTGPVARVHAPAADEVVSGASAGHGRARHRPHADTAATLYRCSVASLHVRTSRRPLGIAGLRRLAERLLEHRRGPPTGDHYLWGYAYYDDAFGQSHSYRAAVRRRDRHAGGADLQRLRRPLLLAQRRRPRGQGGPSYCLDAPADVQLDDPRARRRRRCGPSRARAVRRAARRSPGTAATTARHPAPDGGYTYTLQRDGAGGPTTHGRRPDRRASSGARRGSLRPVAGDVAVAHRRVRARAGGDVTVTSVKPCISSDCVAITAPNAAGRGRRRWSSPPRQRGDARSRRPCAGATRSARRTTRRCRLPVTVNTAAPELELDDDPGDRRGAGGLDRHGSSARIETGRELRYSRRLRRRHAARHRDDRGAVRSRWSCSTSSRPRHLSRARGRQRRRRQRRARAASFVDVTKPKNRPPTATLALDRDEGAAPLDVAATVGGADPDGDPLTTRSASATARRRSAAASRPRRSRTATAVRGSFLVRPRGQRRPATDDQDRARRGRAARAAARQRGRRPAGVRRGGRDVRRLRLAAGAADRALRVGLRRRPARDRARA